ncbi:MAG: DNA polymerase IV [Actinobacteria bacterium]|uniref:DNA-directed DNA polymerase n=1 Tax=freshwater metagenome TaxID=449393 RepID=A0A6J7P1B2_9ZZZZ|nr:DNA polymerase IV [Actinomycetota bacterium]MSV38966.1 DNA polymerase IV [Actinomycetota bacterium]MSY49458.1 DNA polymerase IV [Actinomycetota bacterium]MTH92206.1 DNA polymerase IV [Actinomycetota bacterium]
MTTASILHVDMDAFFASVAERDNPELKGKAVVIGMGVRGVVSAANYEARKFGIHAAMPVGRARRLAPHAIFLPVDMARYQEVSSHIMEIFESFTPWVEPISLDEAFLDVSGVQRLLGTPREIATAIRAKIESQEGITCSVGIAPSKFIAKLASQHCKPNGMLEITADRILTFLHPLPIKAMWGVGPKTAETLERLGLRTIEDIANLPRTTLIRALGEASGASLYELAWGRDYRDVSPQDAEKSISAAETFPQDLDDPTQILTEFLRLTERASARLRDKDLFAKTVSIKVRFADFSTINRSKTLSLPLEGTHEIYEVVKGLYQALKIDRARLRLVGVSLENLSSGAPEQMVLGARESGWRQADGAIDRARERFGAGSVRPARLIKPTEQE